MIEVFVSAWDANKDKLTKYFQNSPMSEYHSYRDLVEKLFDIVINPYLLEHDKVAYNTANIHEIDDGDYQGTEIFVIPSDAYQPDVSDYVFTHTSYGSCSGCDTLMGIQQYDDGLPTEEQVSDHMLLCLHLLQRCKKLTD